MERLGSHRPQATPDNVVAEVEYLASEVRLLAINLAIHLAKVHNRERVFRDMDARFTELITKATDASEKVTDLLRRFQNHRRLTTALPASSDIVDKRGGYDALEAKLQYVYELSQNMIQTISKLKRQEQVR